MRKFSRSMPKTLPRKVIPASACLFTVLLIALLALAYSLLAFVAIVGFILFTALMNIVDSRRLRRLAAGRQDVNICTFARSFDRRSTDPWIIRAVYEEFRDYYNGALPIMATDRIEEDLRMDWEDLDYLVADIAARAGRSLKHTEQNPLSGNVNSVGDVVAFLYHQPLQDPI